MLEFSGSNRTSLFLYLLITVFVIALFLEGNPMLEGFERTVQDSMFRFRGDRTPSGDVVICALDDATTDRIGWPVERDSLARLIQRLREADASVIVCDFDWRNVAKPESLDSDSLLIEALSGSDRVILPLHFTYADLGISVPAPPGSYRTVAWNERFPPGGAVNAQALFGPEAHLVDSAAAAGGITPMLDADRVVRWCPLLIDYGGVPFASSVLWAVTLHTDLGRNDWWLQPGDDVKVGHRVIPTDERGRLMIDYPGPPRSFTYHSALAFLDPSQPTPPIAGKIVIVGATGVFGGVNLATRTAAEYPQAEITATAIENVLHSQFVRKPRYSALFDLLVLGLIGVFCAVVLPQVSLLYRFVILGISLFVMINLQYLLFANFGWLTNTFYPAVEVVFFMAVSPLMRTREERAAQERAKAGKAGRKGMQSVTSSAGGHTVSDNAKMSGDAHLSGEHSRTIEVSVPATARLGSIDPTEFVDREPSPSPTEMLPSKTAPRTSHSETEQFFAADHGSGERHDTIARIPVPSHRSVPAPPETEPQEESPIRAEEPLPASRPAAVSGDSEKIGQFLGRYQILEEIGRGAMGIVYKGIDPAINRPVALKTLRLDLAAPPAEREELRVRLIREAQAAGQLSHPNIVTIYDVGTQGDVHYIAMEYLKGYTLERAVQKKITLNYKIFAKLMIQVCDALEYAHSNELVHRDIKPANIMVLDNFKVKVMDFGIARTASSNMTQTGIALGTPSYISPEQLSGLGADRRSDIYSVGVVMYELLTKEKPFQGDNINKLIFNILNVKPRRPSGLDNSIPEAFDVICARALAKDPKERYQYASDLSRALKEYVTSLQPQRYVI